MIDLKEPVLRHFDMAMPVEVKKARTRAASDTAAWTMMRQPRRRAEARQEAPLKGILKNVPTRADRSHTIPTADPRAVVVKETVFCDWDEEELNACIRHKLNYTVRSSKYPRTIQQSARVKLILNGTHCWSIHKILLGTLSSKLAAQLKANPNIKAIRINEQNPVGSLAAWDMFIEWLYMFDKIPLPDFTPLRLAHWRTSDIRDACLLASFLGASKFEKYLLRIICKERWDGDFPEEYLWELSQKMSNKTGMWHYSQAYFKWKNSGWAGELDPYRWRVEHWYSICGTVANWGCFHAMTTTGWGGVWERQRLLADKNMRAAQIEEDAELRLRAKERRLEEGMLGASIASGGVGLGIGAGGMALDHYSHDDQIYGPSYLELPTDMEASGEEMWEEWWEDDDLYSRLGEVVDLDMAADTPGLEGFEGEMENDADFDY